MQSLKSIFKLIVGLISLTILCLVMTTSVVSAQSSSSGAAQGLQISPTRVELNAVKGNTYIIKLNVMNITTSSLGYNSSISDFAAKDETGSPKLFIDNSLSPTISIRSWVSTIPSFTLESHKSREIVAQVTVPADAEPGGHYGAISFSSSAPELHDTGVGLSASTGLLLLIRVDGVISEKATLASFYTAHNDKQSWFFENSPITFVTRVKNEGNIHVKPNGQIQISDMFGNLVKTLDVNKDLSNVLPSSIRRFDTSFDKPWMFGLYTANLTMGYGSTGQAITNTITFWVIPYRIILAGLLILITFIYILSRLIKVYNRRIIEKSKNETKNKKSAKGKTKE